MRGCLRDSTTVDADVAGLIFVIDSADQARIKEAQHELENVVTSDEMRGVPVEIFANKQDLPSTCAAFQFSRQGARFTKYLTTNLGET